MTADTLTPLIRQLNQSMLSLAAIGGAMRLPHKGLAAHPALAAAREATPQAQPMPPLQVLSPQEVLRHREDGRVASLFRNGEQGRDGRHDHGRAR